MSIQHVDLKDQRLFFGRSIGGYLTRLFYEENDAEAEEKWLNGKYRLAIELWNDVYVTHTQAWVDCVTQAMDAVLECSCRGLRFFFDEDCPADIRLARSHARGFVPTLVVERDGLIVIQAEGVSYSDIRAEVEELLSNVTPAVPD